MTSPEVSDIAGIWPMVYAFFDADGAIDRATMARQVEALVASGAHGIAVLGLASEVDKLATGERHALLEITAEALAARLPLAVTISGPSVAAQAALARDAEAAGARWLILQPPPASGDEAELVRFFGAVADRTTLPVAIQNAPQFLGAGLSIPAIASLNRNHANLCLLKAEGPPTYLHRLIDETRGVFRVFNGRAGIELIESLRAGCAGLIPGAETADAQAAIYDLMAVGEDREAEARFRALLPLLVFLMESIPHLVCYGKRLAARRLGLAGVHDRAPALAPSAYGSALLARLSHDLGPFGGNVPA